MDYSGKIIRKNPVTPSQTSASGVWTLDDALQATKSNTWPVANVPDPISRSLRFRSSASAYLIRTYSTSCQDAKKMTFSVWVKRGRLGVTQEFFSGYSAVIYGADLSFNSSDQLVFRPGGANNYPVTTSAVFRDPSAWYHIVVQYDSTDATSTNRQKIYVNNVLQTVTGSYPTQNYLHTYCFANANNQISANQAYSTNYFDGYLAEVYFIDGQQLTPSSFGGTNAVTGIWEPRPYTGTYGTNGFLLTFSDITSTTTLGNDTSGNGNNWTTNNISLTAGSTYDSMLDVPTQWIGYNTGDVASVTRGNYAVINPLSKGTTISVSSANLNTSMASVAWNSAFGTLGVSSGKWYWESTLLTSSGADAGVGISTNPSGSANSYLGVDANSWAYYGNNGNKRNSDVGAAYGATYTNGDVIGVALDLDAGTITFYKNNTSQGTAYSSLPANTYFPAVTNNNSSFATNFGQRPFSYTPPAGFRSLCTTNLPSPTILQGNQYFDANIWTGDGSYPRQITNSGFSPDLVWIKARSIAYNYAINDSVRGTGGAKSLDSATTGAEGQFLDNSNISSFDSNGFTLGSSSSGNITNSSGQTFVGWQWRASDSSTVTNTAGSITSTVSANTTAGFSIVTYTGTGANATVGHGLGVAPKMIIIKQRNTTNDWPVYHTSLGNGGVVWLNQTSAFSAGSAWNSTTPTSTVFSIGNNSYTNINGGTFVAYCFSEVAGYSKFGSYTGNGSSDGTFVYTGFRPAFILIKKTDTSGTDWSLMDSKRLGYNATDVALNPNASNAENSGYATDFTSNGFKLRTTTSFLNGSGGTYIYMAFAENPFKNALAR